MYVKERLRVYATWVVGFLIGLAGLLISFLSVVKADYYANGTRWVVNLLATIFSPSLLNVAWPWLPNELRSVQFILGICLFIIAVGFTSYALYINSIIREAERNTRVTRVMDRRRNTSSYTQSVEGVAAGRDVAITLIVNDKLEEWTHSFWKGPLGALIVAVGATIIAAVFTKFIGLTQ